MQFMSLNDAAPCRTPDEFGAWVRGFSLLAEQVLDYLQQFKPLGGFQRASLSLLIQHARFLSDDAVYLAEILKENPAIMQGDQELALKGDGVQNG